MSYTRGMEHLAGMIEECRFAGRLPVDVRFGSLGLPSVEVRLVLPGRGTRGVKWRELTSASFGEFMDRMTRREGEAFARMFVGWDQRRPGAPPYVWYFDEDIARFMEEEGGYD